MNLHEECLLKYLSNTKSLSSTTELLKLQNSLIEENLNKKNKYRTKFSVKFTANRI